jgi:hypothetical protein
MLNPKCGTILGGDKLFGAFSILEGAEIHLVGIDMYSGYGFAFSSYRALTSTTNRRLA